MSEKFDAKETELELDRLIDLLRRVQDEERFDSDENEIEMSEAEIEAAIQKLRRGVDDVTYPKITDKELFG